MTPRLRPKFTGLFTDETVFDSLWIRETGSLHLPTLTGISQLRVVGTVLPPDPSDKTTAGELGLAVRFDGHAVSHISSLPEGNFQIDCPVPSESAAAPAHRLDLSLLGVSSSNFLAWLGRVTRFGRWQPWRRQARNRRLRIQMILADDEVLFDFSNRASPWNSSFARRFLKLGLNLVGYFRADLGIGESVRCMARAADAVGIPTALVDLRLPCKNTMSDSSFARRLQVENPHRVNIIHVDPPGMRDLDHHHGAAFRRDKYNIGYWAWELPEFPDAWIQYSDFCQEVWAPSNFAADSIAEKVPVPVLVMPHAIAFDRPVGDFRPKFGLPADRFLFLFLYDLNSYSERKNPAAVIEAFRSSGLAGAGAALVIKVHNVPGNEADFERLRAVAASLPGTTLITQTLSRRDVYELESACDSFVSLHRSEGFGLAVAECMYLGKPVISTDWSGTAEFVDASTGCPVHRQLVTLERSHGPYSKGQTWAEPDVEHAGWWMRRLLEDRALGAKLGAAARVRIEENYAPLVIGARYRRRLEAIATW
jgi:glycosyltransferase involved in cell wall biosynthesis